MIIVYKNADNGVGIMTPTKEALSFATIEQVAEKDVPTGLPYWIRPISDIPTDRTYRDAWEVDPAWGDPGGFGGHDNQFDAELLLAYQESTA